MKEVDLEVQQIDPMVDDLYLSRRWMWEMLMKGVIESLLNVDVRLAGKMIRR